MIIVRDLGKLSSLISNGTRGRGDELLLEFEEEKTLKQKVLVMRTDYTLQSFQPNLENISWSMSVAKIGAFLLSQDYQSPLVEASLQSSYELGELGSLSSIGHDSQMLQFPDSGELASETYSGGLAVDHHIMLPAAASGLLVPFQPTTNVETNQSPYDGVLSRFSHRSIAFLILHFGCCNYYGFFYLSLCHFG